MASDQEELTKHTLNLFKGDFAKLGEIFPNLGSGVVIRQLVRNFITNTEAKENASVNTEVKL